jgi:group I intron endonuclease|nr:MAG TPA_asm: intron associated endonuclease [Caudoviricetes sp.]
MDNVEKTYCVYKHTSPSGKVYIGITCQKPEKRWANGKGYRHNEYFWRAIQKYGWKNFKHEILFSDLNEKEAKMKEMELIEQYKSNIPEFGYNFSSGGESHTGIKLSEEAKKKISEANKGRLAGKNNPLYGVRRCGEDNPFYGKSHTEDTKEKIRNKRIGTHLTEETKQKISNATKGENNPRYGKTLEEETKIKISEALKGKETWMKGKTHTDEAKRKISESRKKPVLQFNINGEFISEYDSPLSAESTTGICRSYIARCCRGESKTAYGFIWRYKEDESSQ